MRRGRARLTSSTVALALAVGSLPALAGMANASADGITTAIVARGHADDPTDIDWLDVTPDGRYVAFVAFPDGLVPEDDNGRTDAFVRDTQTGAVERVSVLSDGSQTTTGGMRNLVITPDGRYVAMTGTMPLDASDTNDFDDAYVHDRQTGETTWVSVTDTGGAPDSFTQNVDISDDGMRVLVGGGADNLVTGETGPAAYLVDRATEPPTITRISDAADGTPMTSGPSRVSISGDGTVAAWRTTSTNIHPDASGANDVIYVRDLTTNALDVGSRADDETVFFGAEMLDLTTDGSLLAFCGEPTGTLEDVWLRDLTAGTTQRISEAPDGTGINGEVTCPFIHITGDGSVVAFTTKQDGYFSDGSTAQVWTREVATGALRRFSVAADGGIPSHNSVGPRIVDGGNAVAFRSFADDLVDAPAPDPLDVYGYLASVADEAAPTWPDGAPLTATDVGATFVTLAWDAASDDIGVDAYHLRQDGVVVNTVDGATTSHTITGLDPDTTYGFAVEAEDTGGNVTPGPATEVTTVAAALLTVTPDVGGVAELLWDPAAGAAGYRIFRGPEGGPLVAVADVDVGVTTYEDAGLAASTAYTWRVDQLDDVGSPSAHTAETTATTPALLVDSVKWEGPTNLNQRLVRTSEVTVTLTGEPNRVASAEVTVLDWYDPTDALRAAPAAESRDLVLTEAETEPGTYTATLTLVDGIAQVESITATLDDGAGHQAPVASTQPGQDVTGSLAVDVLADPAALDGTRLVVAHLAWAGRQDHLDGSAGPYLLDRLTADGAYTLRHFGAEGSELATTTDLVVERGLVTELNQTPQLPATLTIDLDGASVEPRGEVEVIDVTSGRNVGVFTLDDVGATDPIIGLTSQHDIDVLYRGSGDHAPGRVPGAPVLLSHGDNELNAVVPDLQMGTITGSIEFPDGSPVGSATVDIAVTVDDVTLTSFRTTSDHEGQYTRQVPAGDLLVTAGRRTTTSETSGPHALAADETLTVDVTVEPTPAAEIEVELYTRHPGEEREGPVPMSWRTATHFDISAVGEAIDRFEYPFRYLVRPDQTSLKVCASGHEVGLPRACDDVTLDAQKRGTAVIELAASTGITGQLVDASGLPLTGAHEVLIRLREGDGWRRIGHRSGDGSRVTIEFADAGLYELDVVTDEGGATIRRDLTTGDVTNVGTIEVTHPAAVGAPTGLAFVEAIDATQAELRATLTAASSLTGLELVIPRPTGSTIPAGGVTVAGAEVAPTVTDVITIPVGALEDGASTTVRMRLGTDGPGSLGTALRARWDGGAGTHTLAIATDRRGALTLRAPRTITTLELPVSGNAPSGATVLLFADAGFLGTARADAQGRYATTVTLPDLGRWHQHALRAETTVDDTTLTAAGPLVTVEPDRPTIAKFTMSQPGGNRLEIDGDPHGARPVFVATPSALLFEVEFSDLERIRVPSVTVGRHELALARSGDRFVGEIQLPMDELGPIFVDYDTALSPAVFADPPTAEQAAQRLIGELGFLAEDPEAIVTDNSTATASDDTQASAEGDSESYTIHEEHDLGSGPGTVEVTVTATRTTYTTTPTDVAVSGRSGTTAYGVRVRRSVVTNTSVDVGISAVFDVEEIEAEAAASGSSDLEAAMTLFAEAMYDPRASSPAAVDPGKVIDGVELVFEVGLQGNDLLGSMGPIATADEINDLRDSAAGCSGLGLAHLQARAEAIKFDFLANESLKLGMAAAGVGLSATGVGALVGVPAALSGVILGMMLDDQLADRMDALRADIAAAIDAGECEEEDDDDDDDRDEDRSPLDPRYVFDPSGFVFEGLESDRIAGVTATLLEGTTDTGPWTVWDAAEYGQANPQTTEADGRYGWDVPEGWWQVVYEADGFERAYSEVLRVLPPHFDVNVGLRRLAPPDVETVTVSGDTTAIDVRFDTWVRVDDASTATFAIEDDVGDPVAATVSALDVGIDPDGLELTRTVRITPTAGLVLGASYDVIVRDAVASYADRPLLADVVTPITVVANRAPVADPDGYVVDEDTTLGVAAPGVLDGDADADGHSLSTVVTTPPTHGTLDLRPDGSLEYVPDADFSGVDSFTYTADDGWATSAPASVTLTVRASNDAARAVADAYEVTDGALTVVPGGVLDNDSDDEGDALIAVVLDEPEHGTLELAGDGGFTYTADADHVGTDRFAYRAFDGLVFSDPVAVELDVLPRPVGPPPPPDDDAPAPDDPGPDGPAPDEPRDPTATRIGGADRESTATELCQRRHPAGGVDEVLLTRRDDSADGLVGASLAAVLDACLLLTSPTSLHDATSSEIDRVLRPGGKVTVLGGPKAISPDVVATLTSRGFAIERLAGEDRTETAAAVARAVTAADGAPPLILVARGWQFPDAAVAAPVAATHGGVLLLTRDDRPAPAADAFLADHPNVPVHAIGGPAARAYPDAEALSGDTRSDTAVKVADRFFPGTTLAGLARQDIFADALVGAPHIGLLGGPLLLTPPDSLAPALDGDADDAGYLCGSELDTLVVYGGPVAVNPSVVDAVLSHLRGDVCPAT